jgi:hypothetical protein
MFFVFFCKPLNDVKGISPRASCFDGGISNNRVGIDYLSSKSVSVFIAHNIFPAWDIPAWDLLCGNEWTMVIGGLLWQWIGGHLPGCGGGGGLGVRAAF